MHLPQQIHLPFLINHSSLRVRNLRSLSAVKRAPSHFAAVELERLILKTCFTNWMLTAEINRWCSRVGARAQLNADSLLSFQQRGGLNSQKAEQDLAVVCTVLSEAFESEPVRSRMLASAKELFCILWHLSSSMGAPVGRAASTWPSPLLCGLTAATLTRSSSTGALQTASELACLSPERNVAQA